MTLPPPPKEVLKLAREAIPEGKAVRDRFFEVEYLHFRDDWRHVPRGTAVFGEQVVYGYPHIGRILALEKGLSAHFSAPFWAEEKIDGFNVRIFKAGERVVALTRSGAICPFATDRLADLMPLQIFEERPEIVVCAEIAGPENPYLRGTPPFISEDVQLFVFDLMTLSDHRFLPYREKQALCAYYRLPTVPHHGYYRPEEVDAIRAVILKLDREGREGLVFKEDSPRDHRAKYVTATISIDDIAVSSELFADLPPEYFTGRLLRLALFLEEHGLNREERERALGAAFLEGFHRAVARYRKEHKVYHTFTCRFRRREMAELFLERLCRQARSIQIKKRELRPEGDFFRLTFDKIYPASSGLLANLLSGGMVFD